MKVILDILKVIILSIVEGVTEFLPVSSTGHLILVNEFVNLEPEAFANAFNIIIQLGAILSVVLLYWDRLNPWHMRQKEKLRLKKRTQDYDLKSKLQVLVKSADQDTLEVWKKVIIGVLPAAVLGLLFDDFIDQHLMGVRTVTITLFVYGVIIILLEKRNEGKTDFKYDRVEDIPLKTALMIGFFQCLAMVPGTSRSAATIIGAMVLGSSRTAAADFSFFLAIPTMLGATLLKVIKNVGGFSLYQWFLIAIGFILSFIVAYIVIKKFLGYIRKNDFQVFGYYRIGLAILVFIYFQWIAG